MRKKKISEDALKEAVIQYCETELTSLPPKEELKGKPSSEFEDKIKELIDSVPDKAE
ncbi:MAG: hypothetical protein FWC60_12695 [Firmicutes bacterium]|nr:hypothetical protein [Bacillota bacterium]